MMSMETWRLFLGSGEPRPEVKMPDAPPWRSFAQTAGTTPWQAGVADADHYWRRARSYVAPAEVIDPVNAALWLRRPLLVKGSPGSGKTTLIYRIAYELGLGPVLEWPVNSRTKLQDGLYAYDALARLQQHQLDPDLARDPGRYITLRSLGTALLPASRPRALLIDEIDKADPDLPNDLLNLFEEGRYEIPELLREGKGAARVRPMNPADPDHADQVPIERGGVQCSEFPFVVLTSNGEREFPPAFLRRCIRVDLPDPGPAQLGRIVAAHLGQALADSLQAQIKAFAEGGASRATDQLLNAIYLVHRGGEMEAATREKLEALLLQSIQRS